MLGDDVEVRIRGRVRIYPPTGQYQLVMIGHRPGVHRRPARRQPRAGARRRSPPNGLLDANARLELAPVPLRVGLITSDGSAAYHDFVDELLRSPYAWQVGVVDVAVQSAGAAQRIKWALGRAGAARSRRRGDRPRGRVRADLAPFDTELVARAIAAMPCR